MASTARTKLSSKSQVNPLDIKLFLTSVAVIPLWIAMYFIANGVFGVIIFTRVTAANLGLVNGVLYAILFFSALAAGFIISWLAASFLAKRTHSFGTHVRRFALLGTIAFASYIAGSILLANELLKLQNVYLDVIVIALIVIGAGLILPAVYRIVTKPLDRKPRKR